MEEAAIDTWKIGGSVAASCGALMRRLARYIRGGSDAGS